MFIKLIYIAPHFLHTLAPSNGIVLNRVQIYNAGHIPISFMHSAKIFSQKQNIFLHYTAVPHISIYTLQAHKVGLVHNLLSRIIVVHKVIF